jgi:hypothetical protein
MPYTIKDTKTYYIYNADPKDTSCEICLVNDGKIFEEDNVPLLPVHPNCNCTAKIIEPITFMKTLLVNVKEGDIILTMIFFLKHVVVIGCVFHYRQYRSYIIPMMD